jgi:nicotinamidase-related amidase
MATLSLPKGKTAILVMDCQNDIVHENGKMAPMSKGEMPKMIKERNVLGTIARLAAAGRTAGVPIIHVRHAYRPDYADVPQNVPLLRAAKKLETLKDGTWGAEIHQDVAPQPSDIVITKTRVSSFYSSPLEAILSAQGITHLVLTGIATDGVVEGTARDGIDRGYYVIIPDDCCAATSAEAHRVILTGVLSMMATVCTADDVIKALPQ